MLHGLKSAAPCGHLQRLVRPIQCATVRRWVGSRAPPPDNPAAPQWTSEMLKNINANSVDSIKSPHQPRQYKSIKELPTLDELGEVNRADNLYGKARKDRNLFDTYLTPNPVPVSIPEAAPNLVSSMLMHDGTCKRFEMNRTEAMNALDLNFVRDIRRLFQQWDDSPGIITFMAHTVLAGRMFCPGTDLRAILEAGKGSRYTREFYHGLYNLASVISSIKKPAFCVADGPMFGSASAFFAGQFRTTTNSTIFAVPDVLVGFFPDCGIVHKLAPLNEVGRYIALTGRRLNAADLHFLGIANYHMDSAMEVKGIQTSLGLLQHDDVYRIMSQLLHMPVEPPTDKNSLDKVMHLVKRVFKKRSIQLMMAELEKIKQEPEDGVNGAGAQEWAGRTLRRMKRASPVSLLVTLEYLNMVSREGLTFDDCLAMDFRLSQRFVETEDYWKGIEAACDKNRSATWSYNSVDDVPQDLVRSFFMPFEDSRKEFKAIYSRPTENVRDWSKYYDDFMVELTLPAAKPRIWQDDGSLVLARIPLPHNALTTEQILDIPTFQDIRKSLEGWKEICYRLDFALRHKNHNHLVLELARTFHKEILGTAYTQIRKFVTKSTDIPVMYLDLGTEVLDSMQPILRSSRVSNDPEEWLMAAKDIIPIIASNMHQLSLMLNPLPIPDNFQTEVGEMGIAAYDRGLVEDVDYVSV